MPKPQRSPSIKTKKNNDSDSSASTAATDPKSSQVMPPRISRKKYRSDCEDSDDSVRKKVRSESEDFHNFKNEMKDMLSNMFTTFTTKQNERMNAIEKQISEVKSHTVVIADVEQSLTFMSDQLTEMKKKIDILEGDKKEINNQIILLEEKVEGIEKSTRKTCIELRGVPKMKYEKKENLFCMLENLLTTLKVEYSSSDLRDVYRIPNKNTNTSTVIAEFSSTLIKETVLKNAKSHNLNSELPNLNTSHLGLEESTLPIFLSENLTSKARRLYYLARQLAKTKDYSYCWTSNGSVFLRKREGMPHIVVKNEAQLDSMINTA